MNINSFMTERAEQPARHEIVPHEPFYFECDCHSPEHTLIFQWDDEDHTIYTTVFLDHWHRFFGRIVVALKYVFGYRCKYGHFDCFIMQKKDYTRFLQFLTAVASQEDHNEID